jgi:condensation domain-containing protein/phosphopantetheine binding protein
MSWESSDTLGRDLIAIIQRRLSLSAPPQPGDDLFTLGASSLDIMNIAHDVSDVIGRTLSARAVLENPTPTLLRELIATEFFPADAERRPVPGSGAWGEKRCIALSQEYRLILDASGERPANNVVPIGFEGYGEIVPGVLRDAISDVLLKHEVLRTGFDRKERAGFLLPLPGNPLETIEDVASCDAEQHISRFLTEAFDLSRQAPARFLLIRATDGTHYLVMSIEHIAFDLLSLPVLRRDLSQAYESRLKGCEPRLSPLPYQFCDYAAAQRRLLDGPKGQKAVSYWSRALADTGPFPPVELPCVPGRAPTELGPEGMATAHLGSQTIARMRQWLAASGASWFQLLLAALTRGAAAICKEPFPGVVVPYHGRDWWRSEELIGCFVNLPVVRLSEPLADGEKLVNATRAAVMAAVAHADLPFVEVLRLLFPSAYGHAAGVPYAFFDVQDSGLVTENWAMGACSWTFRPRPQRMPKVQPGISIYGSVDDSDVSITVSYSAGVQDDGQMGRLATSILRSAEEICGLQPLTDPAP